MVPANQRILAFAAAAALALLLGSLTLGGLAVRQSAGDDSTFQSLRYHLVPSNSARGKQLFVNKGCVVCMPSTAPAATPARPWMSTLRPRRG